MGLLYGLYGGRSDGFQPGGASYETGFCPHGGKVSRIYGDVPDILWQCLMRSLRRLVKGN